MVKPLKNCKTRSKISRQSLVQPRTFLMWLKKLLNKSLITLKTDCNWILAQGDWRTSIWTSVLRTPIGWFRPSESKRTMKQRVRRNFWTRRSTLSMRRQLRRSKLRLLNSEETSGLNWSSSRLKAQNFLRTRNASKIKSIKAMAHTRTTWNWKVKDLWRHFRRFSRWICQSLPAATLFLDRPANRKRS